MKGLTALPSPDGARVLYSGSSESGIETSIYSVKSGETETAAFKTLPEKCVWGRKDVTIIYCAVPREIPAGRYPDDLYLGKMSFADEIMKIDSVTGETETVASFDDVFREEMDIIELSLDTEEKILLFKNKNDLSLWALTLQ